MSQCPARLWAAARQNLRCLSYGCRQESNGLARTRLEYSSRDLPGIVYVLRRAEDVGRTGRYERVKVSQNSVFPEECIAAVGTAKGDAYDLTTCIDSESLAEGIAVQNAEILSFLAAPGPEEGVSGQKASSHN